MNYPIIISNKPMIFNRMWYIWTCTDPAKMHTRLPGSKCLTLDRDSAVETYKYHSGSRLSPDLYHPPHHTIFGHQCQTRDTLWSKSTVAHQFVYTTFAQHVQANRSLRTWCLAYSRSVRRRHDSSGERRLPYHLHTSPFMRCYATSLWLHRRCPRDQGGSHEARRRRQRSRNCLAFIHGIARRRGPKWSWEERAPAGR